MFACGFPRALNSWYQQEIREKNSQLWSARRDAAENSKENTIIEAEGILVTQSQVMFVQTEMLSINKYTSSSSR